MYYKSIILLLLFSVQVHSQIDELSKYAFIYKLTHQTDSTDVYSKKSEDMLLLIGEDISLFESYNKHKQDSMLIDISNQPNQNINMIDISKFPRTQVHYKILKNYPKDSITVYDKIYTDNFQYIESNDSIEWKIRPDTRTINGFKCQKATTAYGGRNYDAWFTTEIPISDGPYKFSGLPGLIVKISDSKEHYVFEMISNSKRKFKMSNSYINNKPIQTDKKSFFRILKDSRDNSINKLAEMGFMVDDKSKQQVKRKMKSKNNPIELNHYD